MAKPNGESSSPARLHPVYSVTNIQHRVRILDGIKVSYSSWVTLFTLNARGHKVLHHIDGTAAPAKTDPEYETWTELDAILLQWIYSTVSDELLPRVMSDPSTALEAWNRVKAIFLNNKGARAASLDNEFVNLKLEAMTSFDNYCQKLRELSGQLKDVGAPVTEQRLVLQLVRGLPREYDTVAAYINQTSPDFETARSMIELEQHRTKTIEGPPPPSTGAAMAAQQPQTEAPIWEQPQPGNPRPSSRGSRHRGNHRRPREPRTTHAQPRPRAPSPPPPPAWPTAPPPWYSPWGPPPCPYPTQPGWTSPYTPWPSTTTVRGSSRSGRPVPPPSGQAFFTTEEQYHPTDLEQQFQALTVQQHLRDGDWFMDTGASSHLTADSGFSDWEVDSEEQQ
ncbi:hypothetical protein vseg_012319 [Gypsophila vaccaria]